MKRRRGGSALRHAGRVEARGRAGIDGHFAITDGPHPRWPTTCSCAGMTTMRLFGLLGRHACQVARWILGVAVTGEPQDRQVVRTGDASSDGTTPFGRNRHSVACPLAQARTNGTA